jgi:hypothetical protein
VTAKPTKEELGLYSLLPGEFVGARNELAKELSKSGNKAHADRVRKLVKPTVPAWAVNRAAAADPDAAGELLRSGERLAKAQRGARGTGAGEALREAMSAQHDAIESLMSAVATALEDGGHASPTNLDRARDTLRALATDEDLRRQFEQGRIARDREPVGFGTAPEPQRRGRAAGADTEAAEHDSKAAARERQAAERTHAAAAKRAERAKAKLHKAEEAVERARSRLRDAEGARDEAKRELEAAESAERDAERSLA